MFWGRSHSLKRDLTLFGSPEKTSLNADLAFLNHQHLRNHSRYSSGNNMLSTRGQTYANSGLMSGYGGEMKEPYHKASYPNGETSFSLAENVIAHTHNTLLFADQYKFLMKEEILSYINTKAGSFRVILSGRSKTHICYQCSFNSSHISYNEGPVGTKRLREATASHLNDYFDPFAPVTAEHVSWTAGVTGMNEMIALNLTDEGEGILLGRPIYGSFFGDLTTKSGYNFSSPIGGI